VDQSPQIKTAELADDAVQEQFREIINSLNLEPGEDGFFRGMVGKVPMLMKLKSVDSSGYFLKLRMTATQNLKTNWLHQIPKKFAAAKIECEIENSYIFLWIHSSILKATTIIEIIKSCIDHHSDFFPQEHNYCFDCGIYGCASLVQSHASISTVCRPCLDIRSHVWRAKEDSLNQSTRMFLALIPFALFVSSIGWAAFWTLYDATFSLLNTNRILVPRIVEVIILLGFGFGLGWPVGKIFHKSGAVKYVSPIVLSIAAAFLTLVAGEILYAGNLIYQVTGKIDVFLILSYTLSLALAGSVMEIALKIAFAVMLGIAIFEISKPKKAKLEI
jgi:hypothetical protein